MRASAPLGLEACFLEVLDERLRDALRDARCRELDALVLAAAGSTDPLANQSVARLARLWGTHHKLPVTAAYAASAPPATGEAVRAFRAEGRRHIAVASLFLTPGDLTDRAAELAVEAGAVAVSLPLGAHPEVARVVLARYAVGAVSSSPSDPGPSRTDASSDPRPSSVGEPRRSAVAPAPEAPRGVGLYPAPSPDQVAQQALELAAGSALTPPCTGPGCRTVLRGALR